MNVQLVPEPFVEIPQDLANDLGIKGGDKVKVTSARASYVAKAMVTRRIKPMLIDGKKTYQIGVPIHWGYRGIAEDEGRTSLTPANMLSPTVIDPNAYTPEFKGFLVKVARVERGPFRPAMGGGPERAALQPKKTTDGDRHSSDQGDLRTRERAAGTRRPARRRGVQVRRRDDVHRLQGVRGGVRRMERHA